MACPHPINSESRPTLMRAAAALAALAMLLAPAATWADPPPPARFGASPPPRLTVVLVIDQLRADYLGRFRSMLGQDGIGELLDKGAYWPYAEYDIIQAMTGPGHATISTGTWPSHHGIVLNYWADRETGEPVYCAEDPATAWVGAKTPDHAGTSPRNLRAPTLGDALKNSGQPSRVVSVAIKDRAAIMMGGRRADDAVWFDAASFQWVSSAFYRPDGALLPWTVELNAALAKRRGQKAVWRARGGNKGPVDDGSTDGFAVSRTIGSDPEIVESDLGPALTTDAALAAARFHRLGADPTPDLLWVSYSSFDKVGHDFGPNHRRMEEMLAATDREVARLIEALAVQAGGRQHLTVVLTGDHGVAPVPEYARRHRLDAGRLDFPEARDGLEAHLVGAFGAPPGGGRWVRRFRELNVFLPPGATAAHRAAAAAYLRGLAAVRYAYTPDDVAADRLPPPPLDRRVRHQHVPGRNGDVSIVLEPYHIYARGVTGHLTGYTYDRLVPLIIMGGPFERGVYSRRARVIDLAMTLSFILGIQPPALAEGRVLREALPTAL